MAAAYELTPLKDVCLSKCHSPLGFLLGLLLLPLLVPTLIFGIEAIGAALSDADSFAASFLLLIAVSLAAMVLAPPAAAGALRFQLQ